MTIEFSCNQWNSQIKWCNQGNSAKVVPPCFKSIFSTILDFFKKKNMKKGTPNLKKHRPEILEKAATQVREQLTKKSKISPN